MTAHPDRFGYVHGIEWAMDQLKAGKRVRREAWPEEWGKDSQSGKQFLAQVHLFTRDLKAFTDMGHWQYGIIRGYGGVIGADPSDDSQRARDMSGLGWSPTTEDVVTKDWDIV